VQGDAVVSFVIDSNGALLFARVVKSSGHEALDTAALALLETASPFPPIPAALGVTQYSATVPIRYALR